MTGESAPNQPVGDVPPVAGWPAESVGRVEKLEAMRAMGVNPYPNRYARTHSLSEIVAKFEGQTAEQLAALTVPVRELQMSPISSVPVDES